MSQGKFVRMQCDSCPKVLEMKIPDGKKEQVLGWGVTFEMGPSSRLQDQRDYCPKCWTTIKAAIDRLKAGGTL